jgi:hypothetical protein
MVAFPSVCTHGLKCLAMCLYLTRSQALIQPAPEPVPPELEKLIFTAVHLCRSSLLPLLFFIEIFFIQGL